MKVLKGFSNKAEIVDISHKARKTIFRWDKEFWHEGGAVIVNQILYRARYDSRSD